MANKPPKPDSGVKSNTDRRQVTHDEMPAEFAQHDPQQKREAFVMNSFKPPSKPPGQGGGDDKK